MKEKFNPNVIEINILGINKKIDLQESLITKNVTPLELNKKLSVLPSMYSYYGTLRIKLDSLIDERKEEFERWFAKAVSKIDDKSLTSEKAKERAVRNSEVLGKKYDSFKNELRELKYFHGLADIMRKGYNTQFFCIKEQVGLIMNKKNDISFKDVTKETFIRRK